MAALLDMFPYGPSAFFHILFTARVCVFIRQARLSIIAVPGAVPRQSETASLLLPSPTAEAATGTGEKDHANPRMNGRAFGLSSTHSHRIASPLRVSDVALPTIVLESQNYARLFRLGFGVFSLKLSDEPSA